MSKQIAELHVIWIGGGSCEGCTMAVLGATEPGLEDLLLGHIPDIPSITLLHPALALESGHDYRTQLDEVANGNLGSYILILEGSVLDETLAGEGYFSCLGRLPDEQPLTITAWLKRLAPQAEAVIAIGSCATWGGIPAASGSPTHAMGLENFLGHNFLSQSGLPVINVPGCAPSGKTFVETLVYVIYHLAGLVPLELDNQHRPQWLYNELTSPVPPRAAYLPTESYSEVGRPVVGCPVPSEGWMRGIGGCARVGGACIGCTDKDFADHHLKFARLYTKPT